MAQVAQYKKETVTQLTKLIEEHPIIAVLNMENLPAPALQNMRHKLREKATLTMTKRRLMKIAFKEAEKSKLGVNALTAYLKGMPALLFTRENPFSIYRLVKQSKSPAYARAGQIAPRDLEVKAGHTPFLPGPIIGELGSIGIKTGVEAGKVTIKQDTIVVKEGKEINAKVAGILQRLDIKPMEVGLDITAVYENGVIYTKELLDVDEDKLMADILMLAAQVKNLAMEIAYPAKELIFNLIGKAYTEAKALGIQANILDPSIINDLIIRAQRQLMGLKKAANI